MILHATEWTEVHADSRLLVEIFSKIDTDRDGYITYFQYLEFLRSCIGCAPNFQLDSFFNNLFTLKQPETVIQKIEVAPTKVVQTPLQVSALVT